MTIIQRLSFVCVLLAAFLMPLSEARAQQTIAVPDCTLMDDNAAYNDDQINGIQKQRLSMISDAMRRDLSERALFHVADNAPAHELIASLQSGQDLSACNGCELRIARQLGASRVGVCWVQKISNLILNMNLRIEDAASGTTLFQRSVDIRGNTDLSWQRGAKALVDLVASDPAATH
jgi:hypothetical protein